MTTARVVLRLTDVVKTFPGVMALKGVGLEVVEGEVHALVGENGAGKSTLMAVAAGSLVPDQGIVEIGGHVLEQPSPAAAQAMGIGVVYQHLSILEDLTVAETMVFAMPRGRRPSLLRAGPWARRQLAVVGADIDPSAPGARRPAAAHFAACFATADAGRSAHDPRNDIGRAETERRCVAGIFCNLRNRRPCEFHRRCLRHCRRERHLREGRWTSTIYEPSEVRPSRVAWTR